MILYFQNYQLQRIVLTGLYSNELEVQIAPNTQLFGIQFRLLSVDYLVQQYIAAIINSEQTIDLDYWNLNRTTFNNQKETIDFLNNKF